MSGFAVRRFLSLVWLSLTITCLSAAAVTAQTCNFTASDINFSMVNLLSGSAIDGTGTINITCKNTAGLALTVRICPNIGAGSGGSSGATRSMINSNNQTLNYQIYQDPARSVTWGSADQTQFGSPPPIDISLLTVGGSNSATSTMYARILASQAAAAGGAYNSSFSGSQTRFSYKGYTLFAPACSGVTDNPTQVSFNVLANVDRTCAVSAQNISFGSHGFLTSQLDATGGLAVTCTQNLPYTISLDGGLSNAATPTQRKMTKGTESVIYGLYTDANRTQPWGNSVGQIASGTGTGSQQNLPVYARLQAQATPSPGNYADTVVVTVTY